MHHLPERGSCVAGITALTNGSVARAAVSEAASVYGSEHGGSHTIQHLARKLQEAAAASSPSHILSQR